MRTVTLTRAVTDSGGHTTNVQTTLTIDDGAQLTQRQPISAAVLRRRYAVCTHPNFGTKVYKHRAEWMERIAGANIYKIRGMYPSVASQRDEVIALCRAYGIKWNALVAVETDTQAAIEAKIDHMAANAADVIESVEGVNEPNPASTSLSWVAPVVQRQQWIDQRVKSKPSLAHVTVGSPAMHDKNNDAVNGLHWQQFVDGGGKQWCDWVAGHCYPGDVPLNKLAERLGWIDDAFGAGFPRKITETGYTNAIGFPRVGGHKVFSEAASAVYDFQAFLEICGLQGVDVFRYEVLDDPDSTKGVTEANFGMWRVQSIDGNPDTEWTEKPSVAPIRAALTWMKADPGGTPAPVGLEVSAPADVHWCVVGRSDGENRVYLWRYGRVWNPDTEQPVTLGSVSVTVTDQVGPRTIQVGPAVSFLALR